MQHEEIMENLQKIERLREKIKSIALKVSGKDKDLAKFITGLNKSLDTAKPGNLAKILPTITKKMELAGSEVESRKHTSKHKRKSIFATVSSDIEKNSKKEFKRFMKHLKIEKEADESYRLKNIEEPDDRSAIIMFSPPAHELKLTNSFDHTNPLILEQEMKKMELKAKDSKESTVIFLTDDGNMYCVKDGEMLRSDDGEIWTGRMEQDERDELGIPKDAKEREEQENDPDTDTEPLSLKSTSRKKEDDKTAVERIFDSLVPSLDKQEQDKNKSSFYRPDSMKPDSPRPDNQSGSNN